MSILFRGAPSTYGEVSLFFVEFAVYPFAAVMFRRCLILKRLIPGSIRARRVLPHHGFPARHPANPKHTTHLTFFKTKQRAGRTRLTANGAVFVFLTGLATSNGAELQAQKPGERYGEVAIPGCRSRSPRKSSAIHISHFAARESSARSTSFSQTGFP